MVVGFDQPEGVRPRTVSGVAAPPRTSRPIGRRRWVWHCAAAVFALGLLSQVGFSQEAEGEVNREYAIKAVYLYNFAHYVQWPADAQPQGPFVIGVLGHDPFGALLDEIASSKRLEGRAITVKRFASAEQYEACHILFLSASATAAQKKAALERTRGRPVLVVAEEPQGETSGVAINFFLEDNNVRFEIRAETAKRGQLKFSSKLLSLSRQRGG